LNGKHPVNSRLYFTIDIEPLRRRAALFAGSTLPIVIGKSTTIEITEVTSLVVSAFAKGEECAAMVDAELLALLDLLEVERLGDVVLAS